MQVNQPVDGAAAISRTYASRLLDDIQNRKGLNRMEASSAGRPALDR